MPDSSTDRKLEITLLQERSSGTFARVYMARARAADGLTRIVAVKVLREKWSNTKEVLTRTQDEAQLLARLQHPHILRVEAITEIDGQPAIVMEFVHGADLGQILEHLTEREAHFPFRTVYEIAERVMGALSAAYFKVPVGMAEPLRVVHRDIKPSNIMISAEGALKVLDFGTARFDATERVAQTEAIRFGSLKYMSSERREGDRGDHSSDVFSMGLVLLELLHGNPLPTLPAERADHDLEIHRRIEILQDLGLPNEGWDASLRQTLGRMLAYDASQRLDAQQCVKLFRAFKEQAAGDSLGAFSESVVGPMAGNIFAAPDEGQMTGAKFELEAHTSGFQSIPPEPPTESAPKQSLGQLETQAMPRALPTEPIGTRAETEDPALSAPQPGYAFGNLNIDEVAALPSPDGPSPFKDGTGSIDSVENETDPGFDTEDTITREAFPRPASPPAAPPTHPADASPEAGSAPRSRWVYAGMGFGLVSLLLGLGGLAAYWLFTPPSTSGEKQPLEETAEASVIAGMAGDVMVTLEAGDPTVQWVRIKDATSGDALITAKPDGSGQIAAGDYTLAVKVAARPILATDISVNEDTMLSCKPATMGHVKCTRGSGRAPIVLKP